MFWLVVGATTLLLGIAPSRGDDVGGTAASVPAAPPSESHQPFTPYDPGPASAVWEYEQLSSTEKARVDRGRAQPGWGAIGDAWAHAVQERSAAAAAQAAADDLGLGGLGDLGEQGVVP